MASPLRNIAIVGASGRLGPFILKAVQDDPAFNVTVITRHNSPATFPAGTKVVKVSDGYPDEEMVEAFKGQDAVVLSLGFQAEHRHSALVHASIKAGVKRLVASAYGANDSNEAVQKMFPIAARKAAMVKELKSLEKPGWSWTAICCGLFFDFCITSGFFGFNIPAHSARIWDSGSAKFSATTRASIGLSVARVLARPAQTANRSVYVSSFEVCMNDVLGALQKATGVPAPAWSVTHVDTDEQIAAANQELQASGSTMSMGKMMAMGKLALASNLKEEYGADFEKLGLLDNGLLGMEKEDVDAVVAGVVKAMG
ncbi:hypothetical protein MMC17_003316 [Xylographa soralifera]|nr:hypothetical protein [Xylographa soralifera]